MMKVILFNDISDINHIGYQASANGQKKHLRKYNIIKRYSYNHFLNIENLSEEDQLKKIREDDELISLLQKTDAIIINGQDSLHHDRGSQYLAIAKIAKEFGKHIFLINTVFQEMTKHLDILKDFDDITAREIFSYNELLKHNAPVRLVLDSILDANFSPVSIVNFENAAVFTDFHHEREDVGSNMLHAFTYLPKAYRGRFSSIYDFDRKDAKDTWTSSIQNILTSNILITGRQSGIYMAGMGGIPFIACPSNCWKIESLIKTSGLPIPICYTPNDIFYAYQFAQEDTKIFKDFSKFLYEHKGDGLKTFEKIEEIAKTYGKSSN